MIKSSRILAAAGAVASLGLIAAPVSVFADGDAESDQHTDTLNITVSPSCTFGSANIGESVITGIGHTAGTSTAAVDGGTAGTWSTTTASTGAGRSPDIATGTNGNKSVDKFTYTVFAGTTRDDMATTTLTIFCNDNSGYEVKAQMNNLVETVGGAAVSEGAHIDPKANYTAKLSGYGIVTVGVAGETSTITSDVSGKTAPTTATRIAHSSTVTKATTGDTVTVTYGIGVAPEQKAATYEGNVVYTLIHPITNSGS